MIVDDGARRSEWLSHYPSVVGVNKIYISEKCLAKRECDFGMNAFSKYQCDLGKFPPSSPQRWKYGEDHTSRIFPDMVSPPPDIPSGPTNSRNDPSPNALGGEALYGASTWDKAEGCTAGESLCADWYRGLEESDISESEPDCASSISETSDTSLPGDA